LTAPPHAGWLASSLLFTQSIGIVPTQEERVGSPVGGSEVGVIEVASLTIESEGTDLLGTKIPEGSLHYVELRIYTGGSTMEKAIDWVRSRRATFILSFSLLAIFLFEMSIVYLFDKDTAMWLFYSELPKTYPPSFQPGLLLSPISHDVNNLTHITSNLALLLTTGCVIEPHVNEEKIVYLVVFVGYLGTYITNLTAFIHGFWSIAGASGGIFSLATYTSMKLVNNLRYEGNSKRKFVKWVVVVTLFIGMPIIGLYELFWNKNMGHLFGIVLGYIFFGAEWLWQRIG
jgi:hypothetical protein